jgi:hypothetical protein
MRYRFVMIGGASCLEGICCMSTVVHQAAEAVDRLAELSLNPDLIERVVRRADAEASTCTHLDPPIMTGLMRWGRTTRFLREELVSSGWGYDNPRNLSRTIHPSGEFAIVCSTGDDLTALAEWLPRTKNPKGIATASAVEINEQLTLDFEDLETIDERGQAHGVGALRTWFLLFHVDEEGFHVELSLPDAIADGQITGWAERIILPIFPRDDTSAAVGEDAGGDDQGDVVVEVSRR